MDARPAAEFRFVCRLTAGLHARPASALAEAASSFASNLQLRNLRNNSVADLRSVLAIIAADVRSGDECAITVSGPDGASALAAMRRVVERELPACEEPAPIAAKPGAARLPRALAGVEYLVGTTVSAGVGRGRVVLAGGLVLPPALAMEESAGAVEEQNRIRSAIAVVRSRLEARVATSASTTQAILKAHLALVADPSLSALLGELTAQGRSAGQAVVAACSEFMEVLRRSETPYLRARALDLQDVCQQLLEQLYGPSLGATTAKLDGPSVLVAENLTPQQLMALDRTHLRALVLESAGAMSHTAILARSLAIPAVAGVAEAASRLASGQDVLVDAGRGLILPRVTEEVGRFYASEEAVIEGRQGVLARFADAQGVSADGRKLEIAANIAAEAEIEPTFAGGADGIGVFRTEMLFAGRPELPSEDEQYEVYAHAARAAAGRPVVIRLLDAGGDKPLPHLELPGEANPFLGLRGVRIYDRYREVIATQIRAALRASAHGRIQIMVPMVASVEEVRAVRAMVNEAKEQLRRRGTPPEDVALGIMLEVPSACFQIAELAGEVDFFSLGTNDLAQYFFAADRDNPAVSSIASARHPAFLRFLRQTVEAARASGKWIGLCGDMAAAPANLPVMLGLGLDEISVPPPRVVQLKERIARLNSAACADLLRAATAMGSAAEVDALLAAQAVFPADHPLLDPALVILDSDARSKAEAMREIVNAFFVAGRTEDRDALEEALWARESVYSTGLGYGFAIPHCKSDAARAASVGVLRLREAVEWGSLDGAPVRMVVLLAMPERDAATRHMQVFARLARKMMDEGFRAELMSGGSDDAVVALLRRHLETA